MSKVTSSIDFDRVADKDQMRYINIFSNEVKSVINGELDFETNFNGKMITVNFTLANTDRIIVTGLNRLPIGYLVYNVSANMVVYNGTTAWSPATISLKASAVGIAKIIVF